MAIWRTTELRLPAWAADSAKPLTGTDGVGIYACFARDVPSVPRMKRGYLIRNENGLFLTYDGCSKARPLGGEVADKSVQGWVLDVVTACDSRGARSSVYLTKDHARRFHADSRTFDRASR
jgi:hypothetical protein